MISKEEKLKELLREKTCTNILTKSCDEHHCPLAIRTNGGTGRLTCELLDVKQNNGLISWEASAKQILNKLKLEKIKEILA